MICTNNEMYFKQMKIIAVMYSTKEAEKEKMT